MPDTKNDPILADDGCVYMTQEEILAFAKMGAPTEFDRSGVKNCHMDIQYGTLPEQILDLYLPETGDGPFPTMVYVHGGGWSMGTKTEGFLGGAIGLLEKGYAVISINYRLVPKTRFPEFIFDAKTAVRWARAHAAEYKLDPSRFAMAGDSAGGHIALMMGFTAGRPEYAGEQYGWPGFSDGLQAICDMYGPSILDEPMVTFYRESGVPRVRREESSQSQAFVNTFGTDNTDLLRLISPIALVHKDIPPILILHGRLDAVVPYQHSTLLADKIKDVCGEDRVELIIYEDRNHSDYGFNTKENSDIIAEFLARHL